MESKELLSKLYTLGIKLVIDNNKLKIQSSKGKVSKDVIAEVTAHKDQLLKYLGGINKTEVFSSIKQTENKEYYELSSAQKRMFLLQQMDPNSVVYNMTNVLSLPGDIERLAIEEIFHKIIERHENFRTSFKFINDLPIQQIHKKVSFRVTEKTINSKEKNTFKDEFVKPFNLEQAPLLRGELLKTEKESILLVDLHHIICDGASYEIFMEDIIKLIEGKKLKKLPLQYKDFSEWQNSKEQKKKNIDKEKYWINKFSDELVPLNIPMDFPRPLIQSNEGKSVNIVLSIEETNTLKSIVANNDVTLFMAILSIFNIFLAKICGQDDITVGIPLAQRHHSDLENIVGVFINTLPFRNFPGASKTVKQFLKEVKDDALIAIENQEYQFEELVEKISPDRDLSRNPIFNVAFNMLNMSNHEINLASFSETLIHEDHTSKLDLTLTAKDCGNNILLNFEYCTKLFKTETIEKFIEYLRRIIKSIENNFDEKIANIEFITSQEKQYILQKFNNTNLEYPKAKSIHQLFKEQALKTPDNVALIFNGKENTYQEIDKLSDSLAIKLLNQNVQTGDLVGVMVKRSVELLVSLFGVLKAGAAYLPMDPSYPVERNNRIVECSKINILLTDNVDYQSCGLSIVNVLSEELYQETAPFKSIPSNTKSLAYVIYTSGSTGEPKGVMIEHQNVVNFVWAMYEVLNISSNDVFLSLTTVAFDIFGLEIYVPILCGATVVLSDEDEQTDSNLISNLITAHKVGVIQLTPSRLKLIMEESEGIESLCKINVLLVGGEEFPLNLYQKVKGFYKGAIFNMYGPTETTIWSTVKKLDDINVLNIGKPIGNTQIYILDKDGKIQPVGIAGELCIAGDGLGQGYIGSKELTKEKFINNPFVNGANLYKTGDLAYWLPNGDIVFLGRIDNQVKIRGYRIELNEIENCILEYNEVKECVVVAQEGANNEKYLCAYIVNNYETLNTIDLIKASISSQLPDYMVPSYFIAVESIPLTSNGKVNRKELPLPKLVAGNEYVAPTNKTEQSIAEIWANVLNVPIIEIGINTNFFNIGGHSLKASIVVGRVRKLFDIDFLLKDFFLNPTIKEQALAIQPSNKVRFKKIPKAAIKASYELSAAQKSMYLLQQLNIESTTYNMPSRIELDSALNTDQICDIFRRLIIRHEGFRTSFKIENEIPVQKIHKNVNFEVSESLVSELELENKLEKFVRPFDLNKAPLLRVEIVKIKNCKNILLIDMHHIISDGASNAILRNDFLQLLEGKELEPLNLQYKDYSEWQNSIEQKAILNKKGEFWVNSFSDELPILNLPIDFSRPLIQSTEGAHVSYVLSKQETQIVKSLSKSCDSTLFMTILMIYNIFLSKLSGQDDIIIGTPIACRTHTDLEKIMGMFVNTLPLRSYSSSKKTIVEFLKEIKENTLLAFENQEYHFEDLVEKVSVDRDISRNPIFNVMFNMFNMTDLSEDLSNINNSDFNHVKGISKFDLSLTAFDYGEQILFKFEYCTKLFKPKTLDLYIKYFKQIIYQLPSKLNSTILSIDLLSVNERKKLLYDFNNSNNNYPIQKSIGQLFEEHVQNNLYQISIIHDDLHISNYELNLRANKLAKFLIEKGVSPQTTVAICHERSVDMIVGMLAIIKVAGVYIPLDPNYPADRLSFMLKDSNSKILLTKAKYTALFSAFHGTIICQDRDSNSIDNQAEDNLAIQIPIDGLTYIIYTSGSTGKPKGVMGKNKGIVNRLYWLWETYPYKDSERSCQKTTISFVDHVAEIFSSIINVNPLQILSDNEVKDVEVFMEKIEKYKISRVVVVPSFLSTIIATRDGSKIYNNLKYIFCSGEALSIELAQLFYKKFTKTKLVNIYGSSEVSADATYHEIKRFYFDDIFKYFKALPNHPTSGQNTNTITAPNVSLESIAKRFKKSKAPDYPLSLDQYNKIVYNDVIPFAINAAAPQNIGHMTSALPNFVNDFSKLISQLNQNMVKIETSKSLTFLEREVLAILHRLFYSFQPNFYSKNSQSANANLGIVSSGGTTSNITAMLVARNRKLLSLDENNQVMQYSIYKSLEKFGYSDMVIIGSRLMHYSIKKAASILGIGSSNIMYVDFDSDGKLDINNLRELIVDCKKRKLLIIAIVGIAGTTETGEIDPLEEMGKVAKENDIHFHVDAAWGGATIFSDKYSSKLKGIDIADSITFCGHKQLYLPQGISICLFKDPTFLQYGAITANYQAVPNTFDSGRFTIEGSRPAISMNLHASLHLIGIKGFSSLIEQGINSAMLLTKLIGVLDCFELIVETQLNIVCYRYIPEKFRSKINDNTITVDEQKHINKINTELQNHQFFKGDTFVSKTQLSFTNYGRDIDIVVLRVVLSNPLTTQNDIFKVIQDQLEIANDLFNENNSIAELQQIKDVLFAQSEINNNDVYINNGFPMFIGKPLSNFETIILDDQGSASPIGIAGELCIGGDGLARGYLNQPELTHEKFTFNQNLDSEIFRTGDIVRYHKSGNIEFLRRVDHQVKIRGFRVELDEIENSIRKLNLVKDIIVIDRYDSKNEKNICAYIVPKQTTPNLVQKIRNELMKSLPDYMVPLYFIEMDAIPLTPNGKINKKALPIPKISSGNDYVSPINKTEKKLVLIWSDILNIKENDLSTNVSFFAVGGHSLRATILVSRIHKEFNVKLGLIDIFKFQTIQELSNKIGQTTKSTFSNITSAKEKSFYQLSSAQKRIYLLQQLNNNSIAYNLPGSFELNKDTDITNIREVFEKLISRHESFRTSFDLVDGMPVQKIHAQVSFEVEIEKCKESDIDKVTTSFVRAFNLSKAPLFRVTILDIENKPWLILYDMNHIISDGTSHFILKNEFTKLINGDELPKLPFQYKDYSEWQISHSQQERIKLQEVYWVDKFSGEIPKLEMLIDYPRPKIQSHEGANISFELSKTDTEKLKSLAEDSDSTLFMVLLSTFNILVSKLSGSSDIILGTPIAGRRHPDLDNIVGMFVNTLPLRNTINGKMQFTEFLEQVKTTTLNAFENQEYQFEDLIEKISLDRDTSHNPLFDIMFSFFNHDKFEGEQPEIKTEHNQGISKFDLTFIGYDFGEHLIFSFEYCTKLYKPESIDRFINCFKSIILQICEKSKIEICDIDLLDESEKQDILYNFNKTEVDYPKNTSVIDLFEKQVQLSPNSKALYFGDQSMTYKELSKKADLLANQFILKGIRNEDVIAILMQRSEKVIITMLAVMKAGGVFLPLDIAYPSERKKYILKQSNSKLLVVDSYFGHKDDEELGFDIGGDNVLYVEDLLNLIENPVTYNNRAHSNNLAYIIYTSGTTGKPKGVMIEHHSLVNYICWAKEVYLGTDSLNFPFFTSVSFDLTITSIFTPLVSGNAIVIFSDELGDNLMHKLLSDKRVGIIKLTPSHLRLIKEDSSYKTIELDHIKKLIVGGEKLETLLTNEVLNVFQNRIDIYNEYGPTEATVGCMIYKHGQSENNRNSVPIGTPAANTKMYLLDENFKLVPKGVKGELYIGGDGLAKGYFANENLTSERFVEIPNFPVKRLYKTGDIARFLPDGNMEFVERIDEQVKIRGYRIELEEIESNLLAHYKVKECVVLVFEKEGDKALCAYFVTQIGESVASDELKSYLLTILPNYMVPSYFVELEHISLTQNGKVDKKALPAPEIKASQDYIGPVGTIEIKLVEIWSNVLNIEAKEISSNSSFFAIGGHSLKATILISRIHKELDVRLELKDIFQYQDIKSLALLIEKSSMDKYLSIPKTIEKDFYKQSSAQKRLYLLQQMDLESMAYNMPDIIQLPGDTDTKNIEKVFQKIVNRHESFRTSFELIDDVPVQKIHENVSIKIKISNIKKIQLEEKWKSFIRPFDLSKVPLLRVELIQIENENPILFVDNHHIIKDGTSATILENDFFQLMNGNELPALNLQYKDFSDWQNSGIQKQRIKNQEQYWINKLSGGLPILNLPTDYPRPSVKSSEGATVSFYLNEEEAKLVSNLSEKFNQTLYMTMLGIYNILLSKLSGQEDIIIGTPIAARRHADLENVVGMFVNTLAMRNSPDGNKSIEDFFKEVQQETLDAFENQEYQFEKLVEKISVEPDLSRNPIFDAMLNLHNFEDTIENIQDVDIEEGYVHKSGRVKFDINLTIIDYGTKIMGNIDYCTHLFSEDSINKFISYFKTLIRQLGESSNKKINDLEVITNQQKEEILKLGRGVEDHFDSKAVIHELFERRVKEKPEAIAMVFKGEAMSYQSVNARANQLARLLKNKGVTRDTIVAVHQERSFGLVISILAILKAGGAYLPIDPEYPDDRKSYMLKDGQVKLLLADSEKAELPNINIDGVEVINVNCESSYTGDDSNLVNLNLGSDLIYLIYTSGSTGVPKGVMVKHSNIVNLLNFDFKHTTIDFSSVLQFSTISFDASAHEIFGTLLFGGKLVLDDKNTLINISEVFKLISDNNIRTLFLPMSFIRAVFSDTTCLTEFPKCVTQIQTGGEQLVVNDHFRKVLRQNGISLHNHYGPSETHAITALTITPDGEIPELPTIGKPIINTQAYILDTAGKLVPYGVTGELCFSGVQLGRGYFGKDELTNEKFINNPFISGDQIYKTGDLARWDATGNIEFLGRLDHQVKIRGFRIEPGEIEVCLLKNEHVQKAVVIAREGELKEKYLCAYLKCDQELSDQDLRNHLAGLLPNYMIPSYFVFMEEIPHTTNGKVNRRALPEPKIKAGDGYVAPIGEVEEKLVEIWSDILKIPIQEISTKVNFFTIGGHSLKAMILTSRIQKEFNMKVTLLQIFKDPTISSLASFITVNTIENEEVEYDEMEF